MAFFLQVLTSFICIITEQLRFICIGVLQASLVLRGPRHSRERLTGFFFACSLVQHSYSKTCAVLSRVCVCGSPLYKPRSPRSARGQHCAPSQSMPLSSDHYSDSRHPPFVLPDLEHIQMGSHAECGAPSMGHLGGSVG